MTKLIIAFRNIANAPRNECCIENLITGMLIKLNFQVFKIIFEMVVNLLHVVVYGTKPFVSGAADDHGNDTKQKALLSPRQPSLFT
jgi:hypothetical protein